MNIYRLDPIGSGRPSWRQSMEKDTVWACAPTPNAARKLVANKTALDVGGAPEFASPWENEALTSCVREPTMTLLHAGDVVRADGSNVGDR
jgi:hypothetical protein